ncbi:MAG: hypothetical protein AB8G11_06260 [Saprospiraceae bacterium]
MRKGKRYIPQKLRSYKPPKQVKLPVRKNLNKDKGKTAYFRETLLLLSQTTMFQAEQLLSCDISIHERLVVQKMKNDVDKLTTGIVEQLSEEYQDMHYERSHFLNEMMKLCTLIPPQYYEKMQGWTVEKIENLNGIK